MTVTRRDRMRTESERPLFLLAGAYGYGNVGDDAIAVAICRLLREFAPDARIVVLGGEPSQLRQTIREDSRHLGWRSPADIAGLLMLVRKSSAVLVGGGGLLQDVLPHFYRPYCLLSVAAKALRRPVMFYAVGARPPRTRVFRRISRAALSAAEIVTVRDEFSADALSAAGFDGPLTITVDPAITLSPGPCARRSSGGPRVGVSLRPWYHLKELEPGDPQDLAMKLAACLDAIVARTGANLLFVPMHFGGADDDTGFQQSVVRRMKRPANIEIIASRKPLDTLEEIARCDAMLAMRMHANVLAAAAGVPSVALVYDTKVREFMRQIGREEHALDIYGLRPAEVAARVISLLADGESAASKMRPRVEALIASARRCAFTAARLAGCTLVTADAEKVPAGVGS